MSKVEQRPVIGIVPTQVPDEDIVRVYGPDGLVEAIEVREIGRASCRERV